MELKKREVVWRVMFITKIRQTSNGVCLNTFLVQKPGLNYWAFF